MRSLLFSAFLLAGLHGQGQEFQSVADSSYKLSYLAKLNELTPLDVPVEMTPSLPAFSPNDDDELPAPKPDFEIPKLSSKLKQLPTQPLTTETYTTYLKDLNSKISAAMKPETKNKANQFLNSKKLSLSGEIGNAALGSWIQNTPAASLYLFSKAVIADPSDVLTGNNFAAFLIMGGMSEKAIPILEYWNKQKSGESILLGNLGNAYYRLGDLINAMKYLQQCVEKDSLHPYANKLLSIMYLKKGDLKKAEEHATRSLTRSYDEEMVNVFVHLNEKVKPGEVLSRFPPLPENEFPMLKRMELPALPSNLEDMKQFSIEFRAFKKSIQLTIDAINAKSKVRDENEIKQLVFADFKISPFLRKKAYHIMVDGRALYENQGAMEAEVYNYKLKMATRLYNEKTKSIVIKYNDMLNKLESKGEPGEVDAERLLLAKCKELNEELQLFLSSAAPLVNQMAQRQEYISRKFYRDYATWGPYWLGAAAYSFPEVEEGYLADLRSILDAYLLVYKNDCEGLGEPSSKKDGKIKEWEDEFCANFKGKIGIGPAKITWTCNSWGIEGGEGIVGAAEVNYSQGSFEGFTLEAGLGSNWHMYAGSYVKVEAGASLKEFIKIGPDKSGTWTVNDFGVKTELSMEGNIGQLSSEVKLIEAGVAVNAGLTTGGILAPVLNLN